MIILPTVSESGWIRDPVSIFDRLLAYMIVADHSQTNLYRGYITSIPKIIQKHQGDITQMSISLGREIGEMLGRYFKEATVEAYDVTEEGENKISLSLFAEVTDFDNRKYNFSKMLQTQDGIVKKIVDINNG